MSNIPTNLLYSAEHEWVSIVDTNTVRFGITDHAQSALGDVVFVTLPSVGSSLTVGTACGEVESTKSVADLYAPVAGEVVAVNEAVETSPDTLNSDPYGAGWMVEVRVADTASLSSSLLDAAGYEALLAG